MSSPYADRIDSVINVGRFSSTLLQQSGAQKRVRNVGGQWANTFAHNKGTEVFSDASAIVLSDKQLVRGFLNENTYNVVKAYFEGRGTTASNSDTMASLIIDTAIMLNVTPMSLLESIPGDSSVIINATAYTNLNALRTVSDQQNLVSIIRNNNSLKSRSIRA